LVAEVFLWQQILKIKAIRSSTSIMVKNRQEIWRSSVETEKELRSGIAGADSKAGWAKVSYVPAVIGLPGVKLAAVTTRNEQRAREAAEAFGAHRWFSDPFAMIRDDRVDLVTISVKVPAHYELVLAALDAGKAVYCEAPLGRTEDMVSTVGSLHTAIGLQGRLNPTVRRAVQLIRSGNIGRPLNARIVSAAPGIGRPELPSTLDYLNKTSSGTNLLTISAGLDIVDMVLGPIVEVDARTEILWPSIKLTDTGDESLRQTPDHVDVLGKTRSGCIFTAHISGGLGPEDARFSFEIRGSEGWLILSGGHSYRFQAGDLKLTSSVPFEAAEEATVSGGFMGAAINIGEVYTHFVRDLHAGTYSTPGFEHALHNARPDLIRLS
jgi:predicted dehydrogenase